MPASRSCAVADCDRGHYAKGRCFRHWLQEWRRQDRERGQRASCSIEGCDKPYVSRGWCDQHYARWKRHGDPLYQRPSAPPRRPSRPRRRGPRPTTTKARAQVAGVGVSAYNPRARVKSTPRTAMVRVNTPRPGYYDTAELLAELERETERSLRLDPPS